MGRGDIAVFEEGCICTLSSIPLSLESEFSSVFSFFISDSCTRPRNRSRGNASSMIPGACISSYAAVASPPAYLIMIFDPPGCSLWKSETS